MINHNEFYNNTAFSGGVYSFEWMVGVQIYLNNNNYTQNTANFGKIYNNLSSEFLKKEELDLLVKVQLKYMIQTQ